MSKCPKCGVEVESGMKFCGECGLPIPQTKKCPKCGLELPLATKFCGECGYNFNAAGAGGGSIIGDKNVIAGDVHIDQSSTVTNNTVNNVTNSIVNHYQATEVLDCAICERKIAITESYKCKCCGKMVCVDHFDKAKCWCVTCVEKEALELKRQVVAAESELKTLIMAMLAGGCIGPEEDEEIRRTAEASKISKDRVIALKEEVAQALGVSLG